MDLSKKVIKILEGNSTKKINFEITVATIKTDTITLPPPLSAPPPMGGVDAQPNSSSSKRISPLPHTYTFSPSTYNTRSQPEVRSFKHSFFANILINHQKYLDIAAAIKREEICVYPYDSSVPGYNIQNVGMYVYQNNAFYINDKLPVPTLSDGQSLIDNRMELGVIHEATHAICDASYAGKDGRIKNETAEAIAYLAQALVKERLGGIESEPLAAAAQNLVQTLKMKRPQSFPPVRIFENQITSLTTLIAQDKDYLKQIRSNPWVLFDGIPNSGKPIDSKKRKRWLFF